MCHYDDWDGQDAYLMYGSGFYVYGGAMGGSPSGNESFYGYLVGNMRNEAINGRILVLDVNANGMAGYRMGDVGGHYYPGINQFGATAGFPFTPIEPTTVTPADLYSSLIPYYFGAYSLPGTFQDGGTLYATYLMGDPLRIDGHNWGIFNYGTGGTYAGATSDAWSLPFGAFWEGYYDYDYGFLLGLLAGTSWGDPDISGTFQATGLTTDAFYDLGGILPRRR